MRWRRRRWSSRVKAIIKEEGAYVWGGRDYEVEEVEEQDG